jgi:hypothetical protein
VGCCDHPAPLCGSYALPHNSYAAPAIIISEKPPLYKYRFEGLCLNICGVGLFYPAPLLFVSAGKALEGLYFLSLSTLQGKYRREISIIREECMA